MSTPIKLIFEQGPMLKTLGRIALSSFKKKDKNAKNPFSFEVIEMRIPSPSRELVKHYVAWSGADQGKYGDNLPPHMFTQFALPVCSVQLEATRYNLAGIINQGCGMTVHKAAPIGRDLMVRCDIANVTEENGRARVHQKLGVRSMSGELYVEVDFYTAFIIGKSEKRAKPEEEKPTWEELGSWDTVSNDGFQFGVLTGDLNPIHWIAPVAKASPFKAKVLHGFGMFVRSFELIQKTTNTDIEHIDVRFISPVLLPSKGNTVFQAKTEDGYKLEQRSSDGKTQMVGTFK